MGKHNMKNVSELVINNIRMLGIEMITEANSGHPGIVLGAAPIMYTLFRNHLNIYNKDLKYFNRDRFILSAGHGSALLYSTMHIAGYPSISMEDIKNFRQLGAKTSGHPEAHELPGVDIGTGPLGQGAAASVGFALAEANLNKRFKGVVNHYTYCLLGDGCLQEGVAHEALAIAGRYQLKKLIWIYDSNDIQLDGKVADSTITNFEAVVKANGWNYILVKRGNSTKAIDAAITRAKKSNKPTFIEVKTVLGFGSANANSHKAHGSPLSKDQVEETRNKLKYPIKKWFYANPDAKKDFEILHKRSKKHYEKYINRLAELKRKHPELYKKFTAWTSNIFETKLKGVDKLVKTSKEATRNIFGKVFNLFAQENENILAINNDLSGSTKVKVESSNYFDVGKEDQQNINVGVREFAGACVAFGITMHGGLKGVSSTFLSFADYCKPSIRLAAVNAVGPISVFSHDSITVGEDGPTHQPIEQLTMLRSVPNSFTFRPANVQETYHAIAYALTNKTSPVNIITSRSTFTQSEGCDTEEFNNGYYYAFKQQNAKANLIATGSEVGLCIDVANHMSNNGIPVNVISVTSMELLRKNATKFKKSVSHNLPSLVVEMGSPYMWYEFCENVMGIDVFGKSGTPDAVMKHFGFDVEKVAQTLSKLIN